MSEKLPLWRIVAATLIFGAMAAILIALAPVYVENFRLAQYVRNLANGFGAAAAADEVLRANVLDRARQLDLPLAPQDIRITHSGGKVKLDMKYAVQKDFGLYQVDLHFHPSAAGQ